MPTKKQTINKIKEACMDCKDCNCKSGNRGGSQGSVYGVGFLGALAFEIMHYTTAGDFIFGIFRAIVWPAVLVFKAFELLF